MKATKLILFLMICVLLATCSDTNDPTGDEFSRVLENYFSAYNGSDYCVGEKDYPLKTGYFSTPGDMNALLQRVELLNSSVQRAGLGIPTGRTRLLTDEGKAYFQPGKGFCYGRPELLAVTNFSVPQAVEGELTAKVRYKYYLTDIPVWVESILSEIKRNEQMARINPVLGSMHDRLMASEILTESVLVLTNEGWSVKEQHSDTPLQQAKNEKYVFSTKEETNKQTMLEETKKEKTGALEESPRQPITQAFGIELETAFNKAVVEEVLSHKQIGDQKIDIFQIKPKSLEPLFQSLLGANVSDIIVRLKLNRNGWPREISGFRLIPDSQTTKKMEEKAKRILEERFGKPNNVQIQRHKGETSRLYKYREGNVALGFIARYEGDVEFLVGVILKYIEPHAGLFGIDIGKPFDEQNVASIESKKKLDKYEIRYQVVPTSDDEALSGVTDFRDFMQRPNKNGLRIKVKEGYVINIDLTTIGEAADCYEKLPNVISRLEDRYEQPFQLTYGGKKDAFNSEALQPGKVKKGKLFKDNLSIVAECRSSYYLRVNVHCVGCDISLR